MPGISKIQSKYNVIVFYRLIMVIYQCKIFLMCLFLEIASDGLKGRCFEMAQADLNNDEVAFRKFRLIVEDVQGRNVMTNFHGMSMTTDKLRSLVKKWQTCIEAHTDVKTTDGYLLRFFAIGFTKKRPNSNKKTAYAKSTQIRAIRKKMVEIISREVSTKDLKDVVTKLLPDSMGADIDKACQSIYPLHDCYIRKVKVLKKPKFDGMFHFLLLKYFVQCHSNNQHCSIYNAGW